MYNVVMDKYLTLSEVADILSVSKETLRRWDKNGKLKSIRLPNKYRRYSMESLKQFEFAEHLFSSQEENENDFIPLRQYSSIELFAGAGGMALGMEEAGFECILLNEIDKWACKTLRENRPSWNAKVGSE